MLERLTIQNYALIENLDIEFPDGLVIITGETGAGKSILLGAVSLLSGGKVEPSVLRDDKKNCVVEAVFSSECGQTILRRVISPSLRSRFFIDDEPVPAARMGELALQLLDIHAQNSNLLLGNRNFQLGMIDGYCSNSDLLSLYKAEHEAVNEAESELEDIIREISKAESEASSKSDDFRKLEEASLKEGELEELEQEQKQLENAQLLKETALNAVSLLDGDEGSAAHDLREASRCAEKISSIVPGFDSLASRLESCRIECRDIASDLQRYSENISSSPQRLRQIEERLDLLYSLMRRFSLRDISSLISLRDELKTSVAGVEGLVERKGKIEKSIAEHKNKRGEIASELSRKRAEACKKIQKVLISSIRNLEMPQAQLSVEVVPSGDFTPDGADNPQLMFSANPREKMVELHKVASGGEQSRIMLCIKSLMASYMKMPTMFFDEIDVGVSGSVAHKMGEQIMKMGKNMQVIAITHLPQVASKGNAHLLVFKGMGADGRNTVHLKFLDREERIKEIARLLSGEKTTAQAIENAKVLLDTKN